MWFDKSESVIASELGYAVSSFKLPTRENRDSMVRVS